MRGFIFAKYFTIISNSLYEKLVKKLLIVNCTWFAKNPVARIINRCTTEFTEIDTLLPIYLNSVLQNGFILLGFTFLIMIKSYFV